MTSPPTITSLDDRMKSVKAPARPLAKITLAVAAAKDVSAADKGLREGRAIAAGMAVANYLLVLAFFPETLPPEKRAAKDRPRPSILDLAQVRSPEVRRTPLANLIYQIGFTGMENTIVFLTLALFAYSPRDNAVLFLFNGVSLVLAQGLSRRIVGRVGQRRVVLGGFLTAAVAFLLVAAIPTPVADGALPASTASLARA